MRRDEARLMVLDRRGGTIEHSRFYKLGDFLRDGDLLVLNDTRVFPARLFARKPTGGVIELLMVRRVDEPPGAWLALIRGHRGMREGTRLTLDDGRALRIAGFQRPGRPLIVSRRFGADRNHPGKRRRAGAAALYSSRAGSGRPRRLPDRICRAAGRGGRADCRTALHARAFGQTCRGGRTRGLRDPAYRAGHVYAAARAASRSAYDGSRVVYDPARHAAGAGARAADRWARDRGRHQQRARAGVSRDHRRHGGRRPGFSSRPAFASARSTRWSPTSTCRVRRCWRW